MWLAAAVGAAIAFGVAAYDHLVMGLEPLREVPPDFGPYHIVRSFLLLACSVLVVAAIWGARRRSLSLSIDRSGTRAVYSVAIAALGSVAIFVVSPRVFAALSYEDRPVEWASAIALFLATWLFVSAAVRFSRRAGPWRLVPAAFCAGLAALAFVIGMEEISWMQRIFGFSTPEILDLNDQGEFNLHNLQTQPFENVYYTGAFVGLVLIPFTVSASRIHVTSHPMTVALPDLAVAVAAAPMVAFNWDMWNIVPIQLTFWMTVIILLTLAVGRNNQDGEVSLPVATTLAVVLIVQGVLLWSGDRLLRSWGATEYREMFIAVAMLVYAYRVSARSRDD